MSEESEPAVGRPAQTEEKAPPDPRPGAPAAGEGAPAEASEQDGKTKPPKKRKKKSTARLLISLLIKLALIAAVIWGLLSFVLGVTIHYGNNMYPAIRDGDLIIAYRLQRPYLNAAVLYKHDGRLCMGRVVGMPGNEINITEGGALTVNGVAPAEEVFYPTFRSEAAGIAYPYTVGEDQVFILNDFRTDVSDSRSFGSVDKSDVIGPVLLMMRRRGF